MSRRHGARPPGRPDLRRLVRQAGARGLLPRLPARERAALLLWSAGRLSLAEVGARVGVPLAARVYEVIRSAAAALRFALDNPGYAGPLDGCSRRRHARYAHHARRRARAAPGAGPAAC